MFDGHRQAMAGRLAAGRSGHGIELTPGNGAPLDPMKGTIAPAALFTVPAALDPLLEPA